MKTESNETFSGLSPRHAARRQVNVQVPKGGHCKDSLGSRQGSIEIGREIMNIMSGEAILVEGGEGYSQERIKTS